MDPRALLNEFQEIDDLISENLIAVAATNDRLLNLEQIRAIIRQKPQPNQFIDQVTQETSTLSYLRDFFSGGIPNTPQELKKAKAEARKLRNRKTSYLREEETTFIQGVASAYVRNCVHDRFNYIPPNFFAEFNKFNVCFRIPSIHLLANRLKVENPIGFDDFRRSYADIFKDFTSFNSNIRGLTHDCFRAWYRGRHQTPSWERIIAALMVTGHLACTIIEENGLTNEVKTHITDMIHGLVDFLLHRPTRSLLLQRSSWERIEFLREVNNAVAHLDIPMAHPIIVRHRTGVRDAVRHLTDQSMDDALDEFIPLASERFMGVCHPPFARLSILAYNRIPGTPEQKAEIAYQYAHRNLTFEEAV